MPAAPAFLVQDLEALLRRALSRSGTGAWIAAEEAIARSAQLLPAVLQTGAAVSPDLQRCFALLGDLRTRLTAAHAHTRGELDQIRYARGRLRPTRNAYLSATRATARFDGTA